MKDSTRFIILLIFCIAFLVFYYSIKVAPADTERDAVHMAYPPMDASLEEQ